MVSLLHWMLRTRIGRLHMRQKPFIHPQFLMVGICVEKLTEATCFVRIDY